MFQIDGCVSCHYGTTFTSSGAASLIDVGTMKQPGCGKLLGGVLSGIDPPTLRDVWATAPYLHDGSASTLAAAVQAHTSITLSASDVNAVAAYLGQIGSEETTAPVNAPADLVVTRGARVIRHERVDIEELVDDVPGLAAAVCRALGDRARRAEAASYRSPLASRA